jgi:hypothetical protein
MQVRFDRKTYRKRVQVETVVSMIKRRLGNHVRARSRWGKVRELALVVLTHNLMILWCSILFYRAGLTPLISLESILAGQAFADISLQKCRKGIPSLWDDQRRTLLPEEG